MAIIPVRTGVGMHSVVYRVVDDGSNRYLEGRVEVMGEDVVVAVGGGERPHVGVVVVALPVPSKKDPGKWSASCSVVTIPPHKEEPIARGIATHLAKTLGRVTVVTAGVHDDNSDADGIRTYLRLGEELAEKLAGQLASDGSR
jgi:hypothetical protein